MASEGLEQFLTTVERDATRGGAGRGEAESRVERILDELRLPWRSEDDDSWKIDSDVGVVRAGLSADDAVLSIWQLLFPVPAKRRGKGDFFRALLRVNANTMGSCLAIDDVGDEEDWVVVIARLAASNLDREEVEMALKDVFATSKMFDPPDDEGDA